jgi:hypothetical protein
MRSLPANSVRIASSPHCCPPAPADRPAALDQLWLPTAAAHSLRQTDDGPESPSTPSARLGGQRRAHSTRGVVAARRPAVVLQRRVTEARSANGELFGLARLSGFAAGNITEGTPAPKRSDG